MAWNQWPATVEMEGDRVRLNVFQAFKDVTLSLIMKGIWLLRTNDARKATSR